MKQEKLHYSRKQINDDKSLHLCSFYFMLALLFLVLLTQNNFCFACFSHPTVVIIAFIGETQLVLLIFGP